MTAVRSVGEHDHSEGVAIVTTIVAIVALVIVGGMHYVAYYYGGILLVLYMWFCIAVLAGAAAKWFVDTIADHFDSEPEGDLAEDIFLVLFSGTIFFLTLNDVLP